MYGLQYHKKPRVGGTGINPGKQGVITAPNGSASAKAPLPERPGLRVPVEVGVRVFGRRVNASDGVDDFSGE